MFRIYRIKSLFIQTRNPDFNLFSYTKPLKSTFYIVFGSIYKFNLIGNQANSNFVLQIFFQNTFIHFDQHSNFFVDNFRGSEILNQ